MNSIVKKEYPYNKITNLNIAAGIFILFLIFFLTACSSAKINYYLPSKKSRVYTGLENFMENHASDYKGKKVMLITNHSGYDYYLNQNIKLFRDKGIRVFIIMAPEHGIYGYQNVYDDKASFFDEHQNVTVFNLHKLNSKRLFFLSKRADFVIFDIQDMGMRCYTYISNLKFVMDTLKGSDKELIVLDRPNPISFLGIDGAYLNKEFTTKFISAFPSPFLYDMTIGEAAQYYKGEFVKDINLKVIKMKNYSRGMYYHHTTLPWIPPSPNLPTFESSIAYTAVVLMEGINVSLGRGTTKPFEYIGAPWIEAISFCRGLEKLKLKNFKFRPVYFKPTFSKHKNKRCGGAQIFYIGGKFSPSEVSYKIIQFIMKNYRNFKWEKFRTKYDIDALAGTDDYRKSILTGKSFEEFTKIIEKRVNKYNKKRKKYLIY